MITPDERRAGLLRYLRRRPLAFALWRYSEIMALAPLDWSGRILDLGCGDGLFGEIVFSGRNVVGVDGDAYELGLARQRGVYRELVRGDIHSLPLPDASFDHVFSNCVVEHLDDPPRVFREVRRVLQPGGRFVFTVPSERFAELLTGSRVLARLRRYDLSRFYGDLANRILDQKHTLSEKQWRALLEPAGFDRITARYYAGPAVAAAFDTGGLIAAGSLIGRRLTARWIVPRKGALAAYLIERLVGDGAPATGAGLLVEARAAGS
ncbi:MAG: methyltransferase domain-containing protein [Myxococcota bacterium]